MGRNFSNENWKNYQRKLVGVEALFSFLCIIFLNGLLQNLKQVLYWSKIIPLLVGTHLMHDSRSGKFYDNKLSQGLLSRFLNLCAYECCRSISNWFPPSWEFRCFRLILDPQVIKGIKWRDYSSWKFSRSKKSFCVAAVNN